MYPQISLRDGYVPTQKTGLVKAAKSNVLNKPLKKAAAAAPAATVTTATNQNNAVSTAASEPQGGASLPPVS